MISIHNFDLLNFIFKKKIFSIRKTYPHHTICLYTLTSGEISKIGRAFLEAGGVKLGGQKSGRTYIKSRRPYVKIGRYL